jgi:DMSO/TMAO reductase YedYZ molybdopterin-dependent catalytic subunit
MSGFTRGFTGRRGSRDPRLPPGQYDAGRSWPVHTAEVSPDLDTALWTFRVEGLVERPTTWTWHDLRALPNDTYRGDIHCVTTWSKLDMAFVGVSVDVLFRGDPWLEQRYQGD